MPDSIVEVSGLISELAIGLSGLPAQAQSRKGVVYVIVPVNDFNSYTNLKNLIDTFKQNNPNLKVVVTYTQSD